MSNTAGEFRFFKDAADMLLYFFKNDPGPKT
jgi:hypothetical protein